MYQDISQVFFNDSINSLLTMVISETLELGDISYHIIYNLLNWSQQTYEGQNIAMAIGVIAKSSQKRGKSYKSDVSFQDMGKEDFLKVLSNGFDSMIIVGNDGKFNDLITLSENTNEKIRAPFRFSKIATWTAGNKNVAFVLNRNGEILIFKNGELTFARRHGKWIFYSHDQAIRQLGGGTGKNTSKEIREAIYLTSLDVAFSRTGGCIGYIRKNLKGDFDKATILSENNNFSVKTDEKDIKKSVLQSIVGKQRIHDISRLLRMELVAIDGATIISYTGEFISVGAILKLHDSGISSTGGGRTLAAMSLGKYGLGVKISNDGYMNFYNDNGNIILQIN